MSAAIVLIDQGLYRVFVCRVHEGRATLMPYILHTMLKGGVVSAAIYSTTD